MKVSFDELDKFTNAVLDKVGLNNYSLNAVKTGLLEASLRGVDSHGIRLLPHYARSALQGRKNPKPNFKFESRFPTMHSLDADNAFGHAAGFFAIDKCVESAEKYGVGIVGVHNSSHPGAMGSFALRAARQGYLAFAFTHADSLMLSHNGVRPFFGTNPICFAAPRRSKEPYCLDMSTTMTSWNTILLGRANGVTLPNGIAADEKGEITQDPQKATCLLPIGNHKGYGLSSMVEILCSIFNGVPFGHAIPAMFKADMSKGRNLGQFYMVFHADACISMDKFLDAMDELTKQVHAEPVKNGEKIILPGDKEIFVSEERMKNGIPLDQVTLENIKNLANELNIKWIIQ